MALANNFIATRELGYTRLVPVTPPGATPSANSTLAQRPKSIGKAPGIRKANGEWIGVDLRAIEAPSTEALNAWHEMGASVGIRTGGGLVALDIDVLNDDIVEDIIQDATIMLGRSPVRFGRRPKCLMLYRTDEELPYRRMKFDGGIVEMLSEGRQFVAHGIHPDTGLPYEWEPFLPPRDTLAVITGAQVAKLFARLAEDWQATDVVEDNLEARQSVDQAQLLGDPETVKRAVAALPNTSNHFPSYDDYVRVGYAIKGATQDDDEGLALFQEWAAKWTDGTNDPDRVAADWARMKPPYSVGAQFLYALAEKHGDFAAGEAWFTGSEATQASSKSIWDEAPAETEAVEPIRWLTPGDWQGKEPPPREWEVEGWIPKGEVTLLYGDGGIGKTLLIHQYATAAAAGKDWLGQKTRPARVMCFFCEDSEDELHRRQIDLCKAMGVGLPDVSAGLRIASRKYMDNLLAVWRRHDGAMQRTAVWQQLLEDALSFRATVIVVDTIADTFGGSEIDRAQVNAFIKSCLGRLGQETGASIIVLGHPSVAGKAEGRSGSTAWSNAARSRMYLRYPKGTEKGNVRELEGMKLNYGPKGALLKLAWRAGNFDILSQTRPIDLNALKGDGVPNLEAVVESLVLQAWDNAGDVELSSAPKAGAFGPVVLREHGAEALRAYSDDEVMAGLRRLAGAGHVEIGERGRMRRVSLASVFN